MRGRYPHLDGDFRSDEVFATHRLFSDRDWESDVNLRGDTVGLHVSKPMISTAVDRPFDVLLVEDNLFDAPALATALASDEMAFNISRVRSLFAARDLLAEDRFDIIIADLALPDSSPMDVLVNLRRIAPVIPLIAVTGDWNDELAYSALELGAQDYISKSDMQPRCLQRSIQRAILRHNSRLQIERLLADADTTRRALEKKNTRLAELNDTAQKFVDNVSHEFRTPLSVIKEYVSLIQDGLAGPVSERQAQMLSVIADRSEDLNRMVDDMLDVSRLGAGILHVWRKIHTPAEIVAHIAPALKSKAELRKIDLEFDVPDSLPEIFCDAEKIGRALTNLAVNAIKFCGDPGRVSICARNCPDDRSVRYSVVDNGVGIDATELQTIFGRFTQLDKHLQGSTKGFGLGLSIAKELIELNFGSVNVCSKANIGSTFSFTVPIADQCGILRRYVDRCAAADGGATISLLVVAIDTSRDTSQRDEVDALVNYLLRGNDVSVPLSANSWIIMARADRTECELLIRHYGESWIETNRNRLGPPLPALELSIVGTWQVPLDVASLMSAAEQLVLPTSLQL
jgi:signal transduction histidine kinase